MRSALLCLLAVATTCLYAADDSWRKEFTPEGDAWKSIPQVLKMNNDSEPQTLDPALMTGVPEGRLALALFEGLVGLHPRTLEPVPGAAESWVISEDQKTYTFTLRKGLQWSDGTALNAATFRDSWRRVLEPATGSEYLYQLYPIINAKAYASGDISDFEQVGVKAVDERTLVVTLENPTRYFLDLCAFNTLYPVPLHVISEHGDAWTKPGTMVSNGPFMLSEWQPRNRIVMLRNPNWRAADTVVLTAIEAYPYEDAKTAIQLFRRGELHWQPSVPASDYAELRHDPDCYVTPYLGTYYYRFNVTKPPFDDVNVRRALSLAIDRTQVTDHVLGSGEKPVDRFCPDNIGYGYRTPEGPGFDVEAARKAWAETPYGKGEKQWPSVELLYNTSENHKKIAENIVAQWKDTLGIDVSLRNSEWKVYLSQLSNLDYQVARSAWIGDYNDPNTFYDCFQSSSGNNRTGWKSEAYDALLAKAAAESDDTVRNDLFAQMERMLQDERPIAPIYQYVNKGLLSEKVLGFEHNHRDYHPYHVMWLEPIAE